MFLPAMTVSQYSQLLLPAFFTQQHVVNIFPSFLLKIYIIIFIFIFKNFFKNFIYFILVALGLRCCTWVFLWLWRVGATLHCGAQASHCGGFPCCGSRHAGSVVVAHGLSCSGACGIFPDQGLNPCPLHWQADS